MRGAGPGQTTLAKTNGAKPFQEAVSANPSPLIVVGPHLFSSPGPHRHRRLHQPDRRRRQGRVYGDGGERGRVLAGPDRVAGRGLRRRLADPTRRVAGRFGPPPTGGSSGRSTIRRSRTSTTSRADAFPTTPGTAGSWFSRPDRPTAEVKQIASVSGSTITFTTPIHISYRASHAAQLSRYGRPHVKNAGVEDLTLIGGDAGNLRFNWAALSWARNVESTVWHGEGFAIDSSFRIELREFYVHDAAWAQPGGGGYAISLSAGTAEVLIENGIAVRANKVMVARSAGAGSVVGYNYMDMGYINTNGAWIEIGLNASHMVGSHHVLFEGNYGHNADSDNTHGNSIYHTFFRNHLRGIRAPFDNQAGGRIDDATQSRNGPKRCAGLMAYSYWMSFVGNVLGAAGQMGGWVYETTFTDGKPGIWMLGWDGVDSLPDRRAGIRPPRFATATSTTSPTR